MQTRALPKLARHRDGINIDRGPPFELITETVQFAMVGPANRHDVLVADPPPECRSLSKAQVVGIGRPAPAHEAGLQGYVLQKLVVAVPARLAKSENTLIDLLWTRFRCLEERSLRQPPAFPVDAEKPALDSD